MRNLLLASAALPLVLLACESYPASGSSKGEGRVSVSTSALSLPGVSEVCYDLQVTSEDGAVVWTQPNVCSSRYGDGKGSIAYVGPCDASSATNDVSLTLTGMTDASGAAITDFTNPCPPGAACTKKVACVENQDSAVSFDLTVMRQSQQGFLDIAVSLDGVACSAKLDCANPLLQDPVTGERSETALVAFACTSGGAMRMSDITLDCETTNGAPISFTIDPSQGPGNYFSIGERGEGRDGLRQIASWRTSSSSSSSWAVGIAPDLDALDAMGVSSCRLHAAATATNDTSLDWTPPSAYPVIEWDVQVVSPRDAASGLPTGKRLAVSCPANPLDGQGSGVRTTTAGKTHTKTGHVTLMK